VNASPKDISLSALRDLTTLAGTGRACRMAGLLVKEDDEAIYVADPHGTWVIPHDGYTDLLEWSGGQALVRGQFESARPVTLSLREGASIQEVRSFQVRKGGDPLEAKLRRETIERVFAETDAQELLTGSTAGQQLLVRLEEVMSRRLGWDPELPVDRQSFAAHHPRAASWICGGDGGTV
jgi:hypothetical protein